MTTPLVLDFDDSVLPLEGAIYLPLSPWQEKVRFGCSLNVFNQLRQSLTPTLEKAYGTVFTGSGDYHHISTLLIERYARLQQPLHVVVFDNHPDNMRYPFGIHCGSWVWHISRLPFVQTVHVVGITSKDVEQSHAWENHLRALRSGKVRYWCVGRDLGWMRLLGAHHSASFNSVAELIPAFQIWLDENAGPIYLTIDKDVLSPDDAHTNWDQGVMRLTEMQQIILAMRGRVVGSDITGEVSTYHYQSRFKRFLSGLDEQPDIEKEALQRWQQQHQSINQQLLMAIEAVM